MQRLKIPVVFMRGGTSKGLFFHEKDLPPEAALRDRFLLSAMGSPDRYGRQLNGMGGGISSLSKIVVVRPSTHPDADIDYLHGQVAVDRPLIDYSANCGNLSSAVGAFALDEGLVAADDPTQAAVRLRNLNSGALIHAHFPLTDGAFVADGPFAMPGVAETGARVALEYLRDANDPASLFPTGNAVDRLDALGVAATLANAALPCVFIAAASLKMAATATPDMIDADTSNMAVLERLRREGAVRMGLASTAENAPLAAPKIGIVAPPADYIALDGTHVTAGDCDILVRMISMGRAHKAVPLTAAMCLAAAALVEGSVPYACARRLTGPAVRVGTPSGVLTVGAILEGSGASLKLDRTIVYATARRLMEGKVHGTI